MSQLPRTPRHKVVKLRDEPPFANVGLLHLDS